ncbi:putative D-3-phosphoglycerate dehydrogenase [Apostichopus japonicus]|uniref:D-3-phosphoglycerate dehydrogenase n=1 Tax=Stichopus japonicus TaxID=307972 RepID=A0A2G8KV59_STIJA|nr:putative D-3-phosphoglycerate dehydrogenase [Apostichopus japonicus]
MASMLVPSNDWIRPLVSPEESAEFGVEWLPVDQIWPRADYITVHTPLIPQTRGLLGDSSFPLCKKGVRVVNVARGGIIDEAALVKALESGQCGGAALDVFMEEPPTNAALIQNSKVICTPHLGASTSEAQTRVAVEIAQQFVDAVQGKSLFGAINAHALSNALKPETKPVVALGEALGVLISGLSSQPQKQVCVTTCGQTMADTKKFIGDAVTCGVLRRHATSSLNLVNASLYAKELGVEVKTTHEDGPRGLLRVTAGSVTLVGQVQGSHPVLLEINGQSFGAGVGLVGSLVFYVSSEPLKHLAELAGGLENNNQVIAFATTNSSVDQWNVAKLVQPTANLGGFEKRISSFFTTF